MIYYEKLLLQKHLEVMQILQIFHEKKFCEFGPWFLNSN